MSLKKKLIFLLLVSCCILAITFQMSFEMTLFPSLRDQKVIFIEKQKRKIQGALSIEQEGIATLCSEWFEWDDLVKDIRHPTKEFERNAMQNTIFTGEIVDFAVILNLDTKILFYKNYRPDIGFISLKKIDIYDELNIIRRIVRKRLEPEKSIINTAYGSIMFVADPILDRGHLNRLEGILILGRYVDDRMIKRIAFYTMQEIKTKSFNRQQLEDFSSKWMQGKDVQYREDGNKLTVYHMLKDVNRTPAMVLYTESDNQLFNVVKRHMFTFILITLCLIFFLGFMLYFSIDKYIIKRMLGISGQMTRIEGLKDLSIRIENDASNDEVAYLISSINLTLDRLEQEKVNREHAEKSMIKQGKLASIGRLTSSIAHEVNNPLMAIGNSLQVIKKICDENYGDEESLLAEAVEISESEVERIKVIISGLLDFHRLDKEEFSRINLKKVMLQSLSILGWSKKLGRVEIVSTLEDNCFIMGAQVRLKQVLINFILNAAEAMGDVGGKLVVEVSTSRCGDYAEVHFKDNGPGLAPEVKGSLFEPFVSTKEDKGVGLGLYISYKIILNHRGEIIYDEEYKEGAHFIIRLPKLKGRSQPAYLEKGEKTEQAESSVKSGGFEQLGSEAPGKDTEEMIRALFEKTETAD